LTFLPVISLRGSHLPPSFGFSEHVSVWNIPTDGSVCIPAFGKCLRFCWYSTLPSVAGLLPFSSGYILDDYISFLLLEFASLRFRCCSTYHFSACVPGAGFYYRCRLTGSTDDLPACLHSTAFTATVATGSFCCSAVHWSLGHSWFCCWLYLRLVPAAFIFRSLFASPRPSSPFGCLFSPVPFLAAADAFYYRSGFLHL